MPKVSVIVPVFGVEKYIERCARSLFEQTLDDMEFIFVDDCTPDCSIEILKDVLSSYPQRQVQTRIYRMPCNSGLHNVRKEGIKYATGDYIAHCDSDDWVEKDMYLSMYQYAVSNDFDLVKCQYYTSNEKGHRPVELHIGNKSKKEIVKELLSVKGWNCIWDKLAKRELYTQQEILYPVTPMWEDFVLSTQLLLRSQKFGVLNECFYHYYFNPNSICTTKSDNADLRRCLDAIKNMDIIIPLIQNAYPNESFEKELVLLKYEAKRKIIPMMESYRNYHYWTSIYPEIDKPLLCGRILKGVLYRQYMLVALRLYPIYKKLKK